MPRLSEKGFIHLIPLVILLIGIIVGVYLVQQTQIFKPKAYNKEAVDPLLYNQRRDNLRTTFKIPEEVSDDKVQEIAKNDLLKSSIEVEGDIANGDAEVSVLAECNGQEITNYEFSEYGAFPPICFTDEDKDKAVEIVKSGVESGADFFVPYSQAKLATQQALELGVDIQKARALLDQTSLVDRISTSAVSGPSSSFDGYAVTLIRIYELEQDVRENPDGTGKLTGEQEQARREYLIALRNIYEKQHNILFDLASVTALSLIDRPLKVVGEVVKPVAGPVIAKITTGFKYAKSSVLKFLDESMIRKIILSKPGRENYILLRPDDIGLDILCKVYKDILDNLIGKQTSAEFDVSRRELLEIASNGNLNGKSIDFRTPGRYNFATFLTERIRMIKFYADDPALAKVIVDDQVVGFHGSTSGTLFSVLDSGLVPLSILRERGELIPAGERIWASKPVQETVSVFQWYDTDGLKSYLGSGQPVTIGGLIDNIQQLRNSLDNSGEYFRPNIEATIQDLEKVVEFLQRTPVDKEIVLRQEFIQNNFPVAYGVNAVGIDEARMFPIQGLQNEFVIKDGLPKENIKALFVPEDKIDYVKTNLGISDLPIFPLEILTKQYAN